METFQRAARVLGVEGPGLNVVRAEIIEQGARNRGLANPALVRTHHNHCRLCHVCSLKGSPPAEWQPVNRIPALGVKMAETRENSIDEAIVKEIPPRLLTL
jgi:hypothetical protein